MNKALSKSVPVYLKATTIRSTLTLCARATLLVCALVCTDGIAEDMANESEADKAVQLKSILQSHRFEPSEYVKEENRSFCDGFHAALRQASPAIRYVEPVSRAHGRDDPSLKRYAACDQYDGQPDESDFVLNNLGTHAFRLYRLDLDGNRDNGLEEYLYAEESTYQFAPAARYMTVDLRECQMGNWVPATPEQLPKAHDEKFYIRGINAMIRYRSNHFILDLEHLGGNYYWLLLTRYSKTRRYFERPDICIWKVRH